MSKSKESIKIKEPSKQVQKQSQNNSNSSENNNGWAFKIISLAINIIMLIIGISQFNYEFTVMQGNRLENTQLVKISTIVFIVVFIIYKISSGLEVKAKEM